MNHRGLAFSAAFLLGACSISDVVYVDPSGDDVDAAPAIDAGPDLTPPETTITAAPARWSNDSSPMIEFTADEPATFWCAFNDNPLQICNSPATFAASHDSINVFSVRAIDAAGNIEQTAAEIMWGTDLQESEVLFYKVPPFADNSSIARFWLHGSNDYLPFTYECSLDSRGFAPCSSRQVFTGLGNGSHEVQVRVTDHAGTLGPPDSYTWNVDLSTTDTIIDSAPDFWTASTDATFLFHSPVAGATFECSLNASAFSPCSSPKTFPNLVDGIYELRVQASLAGTPDPVPAKWEWEVDTSPPTIVFYGSTPGGLRRWANVAVELGTTTETWVSFEYSVDGGEYQPCDHYQCMLSLGGQGPHAVLFRARDFAGNLGSAMVVDWTVDTHLPETIITSGPPPTNSAAEATFEFEADEAGSFGCAVDDDAEVDCASPFSTTVGPGNHTIEVRAKDEAGNIDVLPSMYAWTVTR